MSEIRVIRQGKIKEYCEWKYTGDDDDYYETTCGKAYYLTVGTPKENHYNFCPHCGRRIKEVK
jgi:DNA-directed RNA polymerase subunit RPC12/RpoP